MRPWLRNATVSASCVVCVGLLVGRLLGVGVGTYRIPYTYPARDGPLIGGEAEVVDDTLIWVAGVPVGYWLPIAVTAVAPILWGLARWSRRPIGIVASASVALLVLILFGWARSYERSYVWRAVSRATVGTELRLNQYEWGSDHGRLHLLHHWVTDGWGLDRDDFPPAGEVRWDVTYRGVRRPPDHERGDPFHYRRREDVTGGRLTSESRCLLVPYWFLALLATGVPVYRILFLSLRDARRAKASRCVACGYDLRASPDRCPECGTGVAPE